MSKQHFIDGISDKVPALCVPDWFQDLRSEAFRQGGIRVECVLATRKHPKIQFRVQGGKNKWWRIAYWHPYDGGFYTIQKRKRGEYFEFTRWEDALKQVLSMAGVMEPQAKAQPAKKPNPKPRKLLPKTRERYFDMVLRTISRMSAKEKERLWVKIVEMVRPS
jgi:hypothetical protein